MSSVFCLPSSRRAAALALLLPFASAAADALTYVSTLGRYDSSGKVVSAALTTNVEMTVALYDRESGGRALWCRRLTVPVWDGQFAVDLEDGFGVSDLELDPMYANLSDALTNAAYTAAWWVGVSKFRVDGQSSPEVQNDAPQRGKLAAVPFALEAGRAAEARGDFTVDGVATARGLSLDGTLVASNATFGADTSFRQMVTFGEAGLVVTGLFACTTLDRVMTVRAARLKVTKSFSAGSLRVTGGDATTLTPEASGSLPVRRVTVFGSLETAGSFAAGTISADEVIVDGQLTLGSGGAITWQAVGGTNPSLVAPNGVYPAATAPVNVSSAVGESVKNTTGKDVLATYATASSGSGLTSVRVVRGGAASDWCKSGPDGSNAGASIGVTVLCPLAPDDMGGTAGSGHVLTRTYKELSK